MAPASRTTTFNCLSWRIEPRWRPGPLSHRRCSRPLFPRMETPAAVKRVPSPAPPERWQAAYAADREAIPYQSPKLTQALCADGLYTDASRCYETDDGRTLVLPLVRRRGLPGRLAPAASLPMVLGGLVADGPVSVADIRAVI